MIMGNGRGFGIGFLGLRFREFGKRVYEGKVDYDNTAKILLFC